MNETRNQGEATAIIYLIIAVVAGYVAIMVLSMIGVLVVITLTAGALYLGCKWGHQLAVDSEVWESRRIARDRHIQAQRERETQYFQSQGQDWMLPVVEGYFDDEQRKTYERKDYLHETAKRVKKVKDMFK